MSEEPEGVIEEEKLQALDKALTEIFGLHGPWVMAVEVYDRDGDRSLSLMWDTESTSWTLIGMARALQADLEVPWHQAERE